MKKKILGVDKEMGTKPKQIQGERKFKKKLYLNERSDFKLL